MSSGSTKTDSRGVNPEAAYMLAAVRRFLNPAAPLPDPTGIDWERLVQRGWDHAVIPMLQAVLDVEGVPRDAREALRSAMRHSVRRSLTLSAELARLGGLFAQLEIPAIALKGPALSRYLYGDPASRSSADLDFLVKPEHLARIHDALRARDYRLLQAVPWDKHGALMRSRESQLPFMNESELVVDIHWRMFKSYFANALDTMDPWTALRSETVAGRSIQTLAPEANLLYLCSHAAKHEFSRLGWLCDIARFLAVTPDLDWPGAIGHAHRAGALRQLLLSVRLAGGLLDAPTPTMPQDRAVDALAAAIQRRLLSGADPAVPAMELIRFSMRLLERPGHRIRFLAGSIAPSAAEYGALRLPRPLHFLYYPFRPFRLLWKYRPRLK
jgi:hypothetical protein